MATQKGSKWGSKLKGMQQGWKESSDQYDSMFGASELPEDVYVLKLQDCKLGESDAGGVYVRREHVILEGDHKGVVVGDILMLSTETGPVYVRQWLKMLDVEVPENISELEDLFNELKEAAPVVKGRVSHSVNNGRDYTNLRVISVLGDEDGEEGEEINPDEMTLKELRAFVKENEIEIEGYLKLSEDKLREAVAEAITEDEGEEAESEEAEGEEAEGDGDEIDFDGMEKPDLLEFIKENEISFKDLGYANGLKMKKASVDELREKLQEMVSEAEGEEAEGEEAEGNDDEMMEMAKLFCGTWGVDIPKDGDLDDIKGEINKCTFPEEELDEDEIKLLGEMGLESTIKKKTVVKKAVKKVLKKGKKII